MVYRLRSVSKAISKHIRRKCTAITRRLQSDRIDFQSVFDANAKRLSKSQLHSDGEAIAQRLQSDFKAF
jgi:hypothetical protein